MLTYKDILFAITKILSDDSNVDVIVDDVEGIFNKECFYVSIIPLSNTAAARIIDEKSLMISIKHFGGDKLKCYDVANDLSNLFNRNIKVNDRFLNISNTEPNIFKDKVGSVLDFLITISYFDEINVVNETYENMQDVNLNTKEG